MDCYYTLTYVCAAAKLILSLFIRGKIREGVRGVAGVASATPYFGHIRIGSNKKINYGKN